MAQQSKMNERWIPTYCNQCNMGPDPIRILVRNGVAVKAEGNPAFSDVHPGHGRACVKVKGLIQKLYNPNRVKAPMKRTNPKKGRDEDPGWVEISWDEALDLFESRLKQVRAKGLLDEQGLPRVAVTAGADGTPPAFNGTWYPFWMAFGPFDGTLGGGGGVKCYHAEHLYGELWHRSFTCGGDLEYTEYQINLGRNYNASNGVTGTLREANARVRGMKTVQVEPHLSVTGATADEWIPMKPKTDSAFLYAMMYVMLHELEVWDVKFLKEVTNSPYLVGPDGLFVRDPDFDSPMMWDPVEGEAKPYDEDFQDIALEGTYEVNGVSARPSFELLKEHMKKYTPEWAAVICDVSAETIRRVTKEYVDHAHIGMTITIEGNELPYRPVHVSLGKSVNNGFGSYQAVWACHMLAVLVGGLDVPGGHIAFGPLLNGPITMGEDGFLDYPFLPTEEEYWQWPPDSRDGRTSLTPLASGMIPTFAAAMGPNHLAWINMTDPPENWPKASIPDILVTHKTNPIISMWDSERVRKVLEQIPFHVSFAYTFDETNWHADLLLPENIDLEGTQIFPMGGVTFCYGIKWEHMGFHIRQPVIEPPFNTRDMTDVFTELASRLEMLPEYYAMIGMYLQWDEEYALDPSKKYSVSEIYEQMGRAVSGGQHGIDWFKENGALFFPIPKLEWYKYTQMKDLELRYELPYQERVMRIGKQLADRLHDKDIHWWDRALHEYQALPECEDFSKTYETSPEYDLWLMTSRSMQFYWGGNADVPWMIEAADELVDHGGVVMNTQAAAARGIKHGDEVWIESPIGRVKGRALLRQGIRPDCVLMMQQFGHHVTALAKDTGWPNMNPITPMPHQMTDETGSGSDHVMVKVYQAGR